LPKLTGTFPECGGQADFITEIRVVAKFQIRNAIIPSVSKLSRVHGRTTVRELASAYGFTEVALPIASWALEPEPKTADIGDKIQNLCISDTPKACVRC
jgi:hypothetical protein